MAELSSDLQDSIDALGTQHSNLIQAVRDYKDGSVATATNDLLSAAATTTSLIKSKESSLLGLIGYTNSSAVIPSMILDFKNQVYMTGRSQVSQGRPLSELLETESYSNTGVVMNSNGRYEPNPDLTQFRYTKHPTTGEALGVWLEGHSTNEITEPDFTASYWGKENVSVADESSVAPPVIGALVAKVTASNDNVFRSVRLVTPPTNTNANSVSVFIKGGTANLVKMQVNLENKSIGLNLDTDTGEFDTYNDPTFANVEACADGWYRMTLSADEPLVGQTKIGWFQAEEPTGATFYLSCPQIEARLYSTSYIVESAGSRTRNSDIMRLPVGEWFNPRKGTMVYDFYPRGEHGNMWIADVIHTDRDNDYDSFSFRSAGGGQYWYARLTGNVGVADDSLQPKDAVLEFNRIRVALSIDSDTGESVVHINGVKSDQDIQAVGQQLMDMDYFLFGRWGGGSQFSFFILRQVEFYPYVLTDAQAAEVSSL